MTQSELSHMADAIDDSTINIVLGISIITIIIIIISIIIISGKQDISHLAHHWRPQLVVAKFRKRRQESKGNFVCLTVSVALSYVVFLHCFFRSLSVYQWILPPEYVQTVLGVGGG